MTFHSSTDLRGRRIRWNMLVARFLNIPRLSPYPYLLPIESFRCCSISAGRLNRYTCSDIPCQGERLEKPNMFRFRLRPHYYCSNSTARSDRKTSNNLWHPYMMIASHNFRTLHSCLRLFRFEFGFALLFAWSLRNTQLLRRRACTMFGLKDMFLLTAFLWCNFEYNLSNIASRTAPPESHSASSCCQSRRYPCSGIPFQAGLSGRLYIRIPESVSLSWLSLRMLLCLSAMRASWDILALPQYLPPSRIGSFRCCSMSGVRMSRCT